MNAQQLRNSILQSLIQPKDGWKEVLLKDIVDEHCPISYGIVQQGEHVENGVPVVRPVDLHRQYVTRTGLKCTTQVISNSYSRTVLRGDEILLCVRGTTGIMSIATDEIKGCNVNRGIVPLYFKKDYDRAFVYYQMQSPVIQDIFSEKTTGSALKQLNIKDLRIVKLFFPPLAEQRRIVAKIEELMPLVERYGKAQQALDQLNESLPARLRQSILQEAIQGRLVPQDPKEEPASELLKRIRKEKEQLVKEGKLKKKDLESKPIEEDEIPFEVPESWEWVRLDFFMELLNGYSFESNKYVDKGIRVIRITNVQDGYIIDKQPKYYPIDSISEISDFLLRENDLLMSLTGNVGRVGFLQKELLPAALNQRVACLRFYSAFVLKAYVFYYFQSPFFLKACQASSKGMAQKNMSTEWLKKHLIPLPPLSEQKRIVAKVEELFGVMG